MSLYKRVCYALQKMVRFFGPPCMQCNVKRRFIQRIIAKASNALIHIYSALYEKKHTLDALSFSE